MCRELNSEISNNEYSPADSFTHLKYQRKMFSKILKNTFSTHPVKMLIQIWTLGFGNEVSTTPSMMIHALIWEWSICIYVRCIISRSKTKGIGYLWRYSTTLMWLYTMLCKIRLSLMEDSTWIHKADIDNLWW